MLGGICSGIYRDAEDAVKRNKKDVFTVIEALADGGVQQGLQRDIALSLAAQTVLGAARLVRESGEHPAVLRDRVCSPGGTTIAAVRVLEERGLRAALMEAVERAARRSRELGAK